jgi:hypothetical protein
MSLRAGLDYFVGCILFLFSCFLFFFFSLLMCKLFLWLFSMISRVRHLGCVVPPHIKFTAVKDWIRIRGVKPEFNRKDLHLRQTQVSVKRERERGVTDSDAPSLHVSHTLSSPFFLSSFLICVLMYVSQCIVEEAIKLWIEEKKPGTSVKTYKVYMDVSLRP